ncbi:hypothetical protein [Caldisphaera sp.]|uniref:hypothetical protein n=1 Tax=Caldisphaera sp. TaxID=2060322 RepID=UPI003D0BE94A
MLKIGESKEYRKKESLAWKDWKKKEGRFLLIAVFGPARFNSWSISFDTGEALIKKSITEEIGRELIRKYKGFKGNLYVIVSKVNDTWELWLEEEPGREWIYNLEGKNLIRRKDDIPF